MANLKKSTPVYMLHAELGRTSIEINIKNRMIGFWLSVVSGKKTKLSNIYNIFFAWLQYRDFLA